MSGENLDLLGFPIPEARDKAGRPEHVPTEENCNKIMMMMVFGCTNADCAKAIGVSVPTLRKHYLQQLSQRSVARLQLDGIRRAALLGKVRAGDVSAIREMDRQLGRMDLDALAERVASRPGTAKEEKIGKKEAERRAAAGVTGIFAPPSPPKLDG